LPPAGRRDKPGPGTPRLFGEERESHGIEGGYRPMNQEDLQFFRDKLYEMLNEIQEKGQSTIENMSDGHEQYADPADRASLESDQYFTLRLRDRDRKLVNKINEALERIEDGTYGICEGCGEEISIPRLKARPVTTLCIDCKSRQEEKEKTM
jgi:DnaK suppressor protein